jgi:hypothetical protein
MRLINFIVFLTAGALIGWLASKMVEAEGPKIQKVDLDINDSD